MDSPPACGLVAKRSIIFLTILGWFAGLCAVSAPMAVAQQNAAAQKPAQGPAENPGSSADPYTQAWDLLNTASQSENVRIRTDVIAALSSMRDDEKAIHLIENALDDRHAPVRRIAASSLGAMRAQEAIPHLRQAMNDKNAGVSFAAAEALWRMGDQDGSTVFYAVILGDRQVEQGFISSQLTNAWNELHNPAAMADIGIGEASGALLGPFAEGVTVARELAKDRGANARALSATLLGEHPNPDSERILEDTLDDKNLAVLVAVAKALGGFDDPALIERLKPLLSKKTMPVFKHSDAVHFMAAAAIIRLHNHGKPDLPVITADLLRRLPASLVSE